MSGLARIALAAAIAVSACGDATPGDASSSPGTGERPLDGGCVAGFEAIDGDAGCTPVLPEAACAPGTRAAIGSATCLPVGVTTCAPGFEPDASGWGCDAILPDAACAIGSGTRERLGSRTCAPVSDCNAPFPPAAATVTVSAAYEDAQLDGTHFRSIAEAVVAAPSGATIAVDKGTYVEKVTLQHRPVSIVGRCAEQVVLQQTAGVIGSGISIGTNDDALLRNLTLRGFNAGVAVLGGKARLEAMVIEDGLLAGVVGGNFGTEVFLTNVVVRGMRVRAGGDQAFGVFASKGASVIVEDSVFSGNDFVNAGATEEGTTLRLARSILRDGRPIGTKRLHGMGVYAAQGAAVTVDESAIVDNSGAGVDVHDAGGDRSSGVLRRSVIRRTKLDGGGNGRGIEVTGSGLVVEQSTLGGSAQAELLTGAGADVKLTDVTMLGAPPRDANDRGGLGILADSSALEARSLAVVSPRAGIELQGESKLTMDSSVVVGTRSAPLFYENGHWIGLGIAVEPKASLTLRRSTVQDARTIGILVLGRAALSESLVRGTRASDDGSYGRGISAQNGAALTLERSAIADNVEAGVIVMLGGSTFAMTDTTVSNTALDTAGRYGMGVLLGGEVAGTVERCTVAENKGVGLAVAAAGAHVRSTTFSRNTVAVHAQDGSSLLEGDTGGDALSLLISRDTRFVENASRVGTGVVPLPAVLDVQPR